VLGFRLIALIAAAALAGDAYAAPPSHTIPLPRARPAIKTDKTATKNLAAQKPGAARTSTAPLALAPAAPATVSAVSLEARPTRAPAMRPSPPFALAATSMTSPMDLGAVKQALDLVHKNRQDEATGLEASISDPLARKLVEWAVLRSEDGSNDFSRYAAFIAANPSWPSITTLRRRAEAVMWQEHADPQATIAFFAAEPPHTTKGHFALARALLAQGDRAGAQATLRATWRNDGFSADLEEQARAMFADLITAGDDQVRMDARFNVEDDDAGLRAARHLDGAALAIAKARAAVINKAGNAKALLDAVPESARHDAGYIFSRVQWLRRSDKIPEAAQWMAAAPRDPARLVDVDQWWVERRLVARKLLDLGDNKLAYEIASGAATPVNENYRAEQQFTAGWIALRFLREPAVALGHFARIADGVSNPITLARSFYWQGRAAEAMGRDQEARAHYEEAAHYPTAYYGQLARARLGLNEVTLRAEPPAEQRPLELARVFEILYAVNEPDMVASMAADLGDKATDVAALATLAQIAKHRNDARSALLIGKTALSHGLPLERFAFPAFGVPDYHQIGPEVERCVVFSIIRQESAFNPRVVSSANAIGLMQVTPDAGRTTAKKFNVSFDQQRLSSDIVYNAQLGTAELGDDIASYRGSYILAFASYNAGRRRAKEWIDQYGDPRDPHVDPIDWVERIPFSETRNYVERVLENMQVYRALLENNSKLSIEADMRRGG
jgi:soluble lytic murein transglycosylase